MVRVNGHLSELSVSSVLYIVAHESILRESVL